MQFTKVIPEDREPLERKREPIIQRVIRLFENKMNKDGKTVKPVYVAISLFITLMLAIGGFLSYRTAKQQEAMGDELITYTQISQEEAKEIMDNDSGFVIIDAREQDEYDTGHIEGAILMPYEDVNELAPSMLKDKDQLLLVYCRSGRRSKIAAENLVNLGYTNVKEFGGIIDWPYDNVTEE